MGESSEKYNKPMTKGEIATAVLKKKRKVATEKRSAKTDAKKSVKNGKVKAWLTRLTLLRLRRCENGRQLTSSVSQRLGAAFLISFMTAR